MERNSYSRIVGECKFYLKFVDSDRGKNRGILFMRKVHVNWNVREGFTNGKRRESRVNRLFHHSLCARHEFYLKFVRCKGDKNSFFFGKDSNLSKKADFIRSPFSAFNSFVLFYLRYTSVSENFLIIISSVFFFQPIQIDSNNKTVSKHHSIKYQYYPSNAIVLAKNVDSNSFNSLSIRY